MGVALPWGGIMGAGWGAVVLWGWRHCGGGIITGVGLIMGVASSLGWSHYGVSLATELVSLWSWSCYGVGLTMGSVSLWGQSRYGVGVAMGWVSLWGGSRYGVGLALGSPSPSGSIPVGFLTREERRRLDGLRSPYNKFWVPCVWFGALAGQARREGRVRDDCALKLLMEVRPPQPTPRPHKGPPPTHTPQSLRSLSPFQELNRFRANCSLLFHYDWISVPLVYTQVGWGQRGGDGDSGTGMGILGQGWGQRDGHGDGDIRTGMGTAGQGWGH